MSPPSSELSWLLSDETEALLELIELEEQFIDLQPVWSNTWTPINQTNSANVAPSSPSSLQQDAEEEEPSASASYLRRAVLASAHRMYETKTARKRKSLTASPPYIRKRGAVGVSLEDVDHLAGLSQHKERPTKRPRLTRQPKVARLQITDSLVPIRSSRLNATSASEKRTASQAFGSEIDSRPKKMLVMRGGSIPAWQSDTDSVAKAKTEIFGDLNSGTSTKLHSIDFENTMQAGHEDSEDLFDNDDTSVEEFLEAEKVLFAESSVPPTSFSDTPAMPNVDEKHKTLDKPSPSSSTGQSPMKPFMRPFVPLPSSQDTSPTGSIVSPLHRAPICFRIAEPLRYISFTFGSTPPVPVKVLSLEIYAILHSISSTDNETSGTMEIVLADIFFPHRPPYLRATTRKMTIIHAIGQKHKSPSSQLLKALQGNLVCLILQVTPRSDTLPATVPGSPIPPTTPLAGKYTITVLRIEHTDWDEIRRTKDILDRKCP
ncbi:hypothetical protein A1O7_09270 [Cladophialophora yegresii CBS 114405]|uniref:Uncharacterized protein n=1 Tax=Cladophialophora yegresii CBS 114405 TaxID=1182544 RepID=W9VEP5_9EURO|nr:uncharacterized protein A1O7_09270 [Cladophialophora yegresii CBS 114405]EXJ53933.1 hypothetical protein A1O7_09270 [Cladophialophora yegresii CBS 114405]